MSFQHTTPWLILLNTIPFIFIQPNPAQSNSTQPNFWKHISKTKLKKPNYTRQKAELARRTLTSQAAVPMEQSVSCWHGAVAKSARNSSKKFCYVLLRRPGETQTPPSHARASGLYQNVACVAMWNAWVEASQLQTWFGRTYEVDLPRWLPEKHVAQITLQPGKSSSRTTTGTLEAGTAIPRCSTGTQRFGQRSRPEDRESFALLPVHCAPWWHFISCRWNSRSGANDLSWTWKLLLAAQVATCENSQMGKGVENVQPISSNANPCTNLDTAAVVAMGSRSSCLLAVKKKSVISQRMWTSLILVLRSIRKTLYTFWK